MKKSILIFTVAIATISLTIFGLMNKDNCATAQETVAPRNPVVFNTGLSEILGEEAEINFLYDFGPNFQLTVTKQELDEIKSMKDLYHEESIVTYRAVTITIVENERLTSKKATGPNEVLNESQIEFLRSFEYSTSFQIGGDVVRKNQETGELEDGFSRPHITVVPENQAEYLNGKDALLDYLKKASEEEVAKLDEKKLQPGKVFFTIAKNGTISDIKLQLTCGYESIDKLMLNLISKAPGRWKPASNSQGEIVEQELVFSFGDMGC
ncbi:MAG: hypothetical protein ACI9UR_002320 [Bacteroidia bacterium]|jgi:hypothetical protein